MLFEHFAEPKLIDPTFIYDFPASVSPLSRLRDSTDWFVDRFELFVGGKELGNAFSELNDPIDQKGRFEDQLKAKEAGMRKSWNGRGLCACSRTWDAANGRFGLGLIV